MVKIVDAGSDNEHALPNALYRNAYARSIYVAFKALNHARPHVQHRCIA
jgi:hypothetical protein